LIVGTTSLLRPLCGSRFLAHRYRNLPSDVKHHLIDPVVVSSPIARPRSAGLPHRAVSEPAAPPLSTGPRATAGWTRWDDAQLAWTRARSNARQQPQRG